MNNQFIKSLFLRSLVWLQINNKKKLKFKSWLSSINKKMPDKKCDNIGPKNVNTGSTYRGECNTINIWRKEEIKKVLIHEMGHCMEIEFGPPFYKKKHQNGYNDIIEYIINIFNINRNTEIRIYEAYNETWSLIMNTIFSVIEMGIKDKKIIKDKFYQLFISEINFSMFQCAKIIQHFNFNNCESFFSNKGFSEKERYNSQYKQSSSIISYYIIKSAFIYNINNFMEFCFQNNKDLFKIKFNNDSFSEFKILIEKCLFDEKYIQCINEIIEIIQKNKEIHQDEIYNSMRMSIIDI